MQLAMQWMICNKVYNLCLIQFISYLCSKLALSKKQKKKEKNKNKIKQTYFFFPDRFARRYKYEIYKILF